MSFATWTHKLLSEVIVTESIRFKLLIKEAILIKKLNSSIYKHFNKFDNALKLQPFRNELI